MLEIWNSSLYCEIVATCFGGESCWCHARYRHRTVLLLLFMLLWSWFYYDFRLIVVFSLFTLSLLSSTLRVFVYSRLLHSFSPIYRYFSYPMPLHHVQLSGEKDLPPTHTKKLPFNYINKVLLHRLPDRSCQTYWAEYGTHRWVLLQKTYYFSSYLSFM